MFDLTPAVDQIEEMINGFIALIPNLIVGLVVFVLFYVAASVAQLVFRQVGQRAGLTRNAEIILGRLLRYVVIVVGLFVAFTVIFPSFTPAQMIEILGIGGVAIGFAFRDILQNFLAGILIFLTQPFKIGDEIIFEEYEGVIQDIEVRATVMRTYDGRRIVIPNADLFTKPVTVNTAFDLRRSEYDVGVGYGDDLDLARKLIIEAVCSVEGVLAEPAPEALLVNLAPSTVDIRARWWTLPKRRDVMHVRDAVIAAIKSRLDAAGIDIPFPTQQVLFHDQTESSDGDRALQREGWPVRPGENASRQRRMVDMLGELLHDEGEQGGEPRGG